MDKVSTTILDTPREADQETAAFQSCGFVLELSPDWLLLGASENCHRHLSEYPARLVGEPLAAFTRAQPLHDLRNSLSRQRSSAGIARAYRVRLMDQPRHFDFAFQLGDGRIILEGVPSAEQAFGEWLGAVSRVIDGIASSFDETSARDAARRVRALSGFDRVTAYLGLGDDSVVGTSDRGSFAPDAQTLPARDLAALPAIVADTQAATCGLFPKGLRSTISGMALLRAPTTAQARLLEERGVRSLMNVPLIRDGRIVGGFCCESRTPRPPSFELHAAIELFAQIYAMRLKG